jgi:hypothetical protein
MIHEFNSKQAKENKEFVNLHQHNRKRRFNDINNSFNFGRNEGEGINQGGMVAPRRNLIRPKINDMGTNTISDDDLEKLLGEFDKMQSRNEIKDLLKSFFSNYISKQINFNSSDKKTNQESSPCSLTSNISTNSEERDDIKKINENLINDNINLKKAVVTLYRRVEVNKPIKI